MDILASATFCSYYYREVTLFRQGQRLHKAHTFSASIYIDLLYDLYLYHRLSLPVDRLFLLANTGGVTGFLQTNFTGVGNGRHTQRQACQSEPDTQRLGDCPRWILSTLGGYLLGAAIPRLFGY